MVWHSTCWSVVLFLLCLSLAGCLKDHGQKLVSIGDAVILSGRTVDPNGKPVEGVSITVERESGILTNSDSNGNFQVVMPRSQIRTIASKLSFARKTFFLYFEHTDPDYYSTSEPISLDDIGDKDLGMIVLAAPGGIIGRALRSDAGQIIAPASGAPISIGAVNAKVAPDGTFAVERVPSGQIPITMHAPGTRIYDSEVRILPGQVLILEDPCIAFAGIGPQGVLLEKQGRPLEELVLSGHPTAKHFRVHASEETRYVRVHHDLTKLEALGKGELSIPEAPTSPNTANIPPNGARLQDADAMVLSTEMPWHPVGRDLDYDFPVNGGQVLYYQFSDFSKSQLSKIFQIGVDVDVFADSQGFTGAIEGPFTSSRVLLAVDVPVAAVSMRFAEDPKDLENIPWNPVAPQFSYDFHPKDTDPQLGGEPILRKLYGQFRDAFGHDSGTFETLFELNLFPNLSLMIGNDTGIVNDQIVPIYLNPPPDALFMRTAEAPGPLSESVWQAAAPAAEFRFAPQFDDITLTYSVSGQRQVCYQLKDTNGFISQAVCRHVLVDLFPVEQNFGFRINGGAALSTSLIVNLEIAIPLNASQMRIFESIALSNEDIIDTISGQIYSIGGTRNEIAERQWLPVTPQSFYTFARSGSKMLMLQFRNAAGLVSSTYSQPITILPMEEAYAGTDFIINGGLPLAINPVLSIDILNVPVSAVSMMLSTMRLQSITNLNQISTIDTTEVNGVWEPVATNTILNLRFQGHKTIYLQFRNADGQLSPVFKRVIEFNPFPPQLLRAELTVPAAFTADRQVAIDIVAPDTAIGMRTATDPLALNLLPYETFQPQTLVRLPDTRGRYRIYVQLRGIGFEESMVFSTSEIAYEPFPPQSLALTIAGAPGPVDQRNMQLYLSAPASAQQMRIALSPSAVTSTAWQTYQSQLSYELPNQPGTYKFYAQVRSASGIESLIFETPQGITYSQFLAGSYRVVANSGEATSTDPNLELVITAPTATTLMRVARDESSLSITAYEAYTPNKTLVLPSLDGTYRAYVQLKTDNGDESPVFSSNEVTLDVP